MVISFSVDSDIKFILTSIVSSITMTTGDVENDKTSKYLNKRTYQDKKI